MNELSRFGLILLAVSTFIKLSTTIMSGMMGMVSDGYADSLTTQMSVHLIEFVDLLWYLGMGAGMISFFVGFLGFSGKTNTYHNNEQRNNNSETWKSKQLVIEQSKKEELVIQENLPIEQEEEESKGLNVALMNYEEKIYYYLDLIHLQVITDKSLGLLQKYHLLNEFLGDKVVLIGLKDDNEKIVSVYLPKILENHYKLQTSFVKAHNPISLEHEQSYNNAIIQMNCHYTDDTMYQLDILEKSLDNMIEISQSNIEDEAKIMRLFLERKFGSVLESELQVVNLESEPKKNNLILQNHQ